MAPVPKPFPQHLSTETQIDLLIHPEINPTGYVPFEDAKSYPFQPDATTWSRVNAWWMAEACWLSYWHEESKMQEVYDEHTGLRCRLLSKDDTECSVAWNDQFAIVAFRGTQPDRWHDIFADVNFVPSLWEEVYVHRGFAHALDVVRTDLEQALNEFTPGCRVWFTGHSLGAALATLAVYRYATSAAGVYTFGSPLVGNQIFAGHFNTRFTERSIRYVNDHDVVTRVPPELFAVPHGRYTHVDELRWISKDGNVGTTVPTLSHFVTDVFGGSEFLRFTMEQAKAKVLPVIPAALTDHTPLYYVLHIWNDFARNS